MDTNSMDSGHLGIPSGQKSFVSQTNISDLVSV
jgi:hypothetical protein